MKRISALDENLCLDEKQLTSVVAALRLLQDTINAGELPPVYFYDIEPLTTEEIDFLAEALVEAGDVILLGVDAK